MTCFFPFARFFANFVAEHIHLHQTFYQAITSGQQKIRGGLKDSYLVSNAKQLSLSYGLSLWHLWLRGVSRSRDL